MRAFVVIFGFAALLQVKCQLELNFEGLLQSQYGGGMSIGRLIGNSIRHSIVQDALTSATQFIVHPSATPSQEMMEYGLTMRRGPNTKAERDFYVNMMKKVARTTPELLVKYVKEEKHTNGTSSLYIDYYALEADIVRRALAYNSMRNRRQESRSQYQLRTVPLQSNHNLDLYSVLTGSSFTASNSTSNTISPVVASNPSRFSYTTVDEANSNVNSFYGNTVTPGYTHAGTTDFFMF